MRSDVLLVGDGGFADLPAALRSARPGDVIELAPGHHDGEVVVDKPVELRPQQGPGTVTLSSSTGNTLMLLADATVRELVIIGNAWGAAAVEVTGPIAPKLVECEVRAPSHIGIRVRANAKPEVLDCRIGPALHGLRVESAGGEYWGCVFTDTGLDSITAAVGSDFTVADCRFTRQGGHAVVAQRGAVIMLHKNDFEGGPVAAIKVSGGRAEVWESTVHGGAGPAFEIEHGVLRADRTRVESVGGEGVLISGGQVLFAATRFTGTHGPAVWMMAGRARFDECEAIDSDRDGFLVVGGQAEFVRCVAHNNAGQGFSLLQRVSLTDCSSFGNGSPDEVGQTGLFPRTSTGAGVRRVGPNGYRTISEAVEAAEAGDVIEIEPGEYREGVGSNKALDLRAVGEPVRVICENDFVLSLGGDVTAAGIAFTGAVWLTNGITAVFENCEFGGPTVSSGRGGAVTFQNCHLRAELTVAGKLTMSGCTMSESTGLRVMHEECVADISDCTFDGITDSAFFLSDGRTTITDVTVRGATSGLHLYNGTLTATGLTITDTVRHGIEIYGGMGDFSGAVITGSGREGVLLQGGVTTFEQCQAVGGAEAGFQIVFGTTTLTRCVAKDNQREGFRQNDKANATIVDCDSTGNGSPDTYL
ncbi:right-handed parallel beta-helix repeat-containing protein [Lentzea alba]|uniref:right-handed parallel beta-helix repeat-containing protein n=1 Tax=Lentzea alba TaxID=2714351 RepID=UPI0039BF00E5